MILNKRIGREYRSNFIRYTAIALVIFLGLFMLIDIASGAESIINGVAKYGKNNKVEDLEFSVFVPLTDENIEDIEGKGITIEKMFYLDFKLEDGSTLRVYKSRENINIEEAEEGRRPEKKMEIMTERHNSEVKNYKAGSKIKIGDMKLTVCGIGTSPDYDSVLEEPNDVGADYNKFSTGFVTEKTYKELLESNRAAKTESYTYAVRLNNKITSEKFHLYLEDLKFDYDDITDKYIRETLDILNAERIEIEDGVSDINEAGHKLSDGIGQLSSGASNLLNGAESLTDATLKQVSALTGKKVTRSNYKSVLDIKNFNSNNSADIPEEQTADMTEEEIKALKKQAEKEKNSQSQQLKNYKKLIGGYIEYENAVRQYVSGARELNSNTSLFTDGLDDLEKKTKEMTDSFFTADFSNVVTYVNRADNARIAASAKDSSTSSLTCMFAAVLMSIICGYMLAVFTSHNINKEKVVIGTLYAMGVLKRELLSHYLKLPMILTITASALGTALGCALIKLGLQPVDTAEQYSIPDFNNYYPVYLCVFGAIAAPLITFIINTIVIKRKLSLMPSQLLKAEVQTAYSSRLELPSGMSYINCFRIRQIMRESKIGVVIILGMFLSSLLLMMSLDTYVMLDNLKEDNKNDVKYEYMYVMKYPTETVPDGGEAVYAENLNSEVGGYDMKVTIMGIDDNNPYFDFQAEEGRKNLTITTSVASKYNLKEGDTFILSNRSSEVDYSFKVAKIADYSVGLQVFMDIDSMRKLFDKDEAYYNCALSAKKLDIDEARLYSLNTRDEIINVSEGFMDQFTGMIYMFIIMAVIFFVVVIYLMSSIMIERNALNISMLKIFGYKDRELRKIYLDSNFIIILVASLISVPLSKIIMDKMMPWFIQHVASGFDLTFEPVHYAFVFALIFVTYFSVSFIINRKIKKVVPAKVLKLRDE